MLHFKSNSTVPGVDLSAAADPLLFEPLITSKDVAENFHVAERTAIKWAREGKLPARKIGKRWYFRGSELDSFFTGKLDSSSGQSVRVN